jgi:hypothetical protein
VYRYRLVFPPDPGLPAVDSKTALIESERPYEVGDTIELKGTLWQVTETPLEAQSLGDYADLMVWPASTT